MNEIILMGHITYDPVISVAGELTIARYAIAVKREIVGKDGIDTDFIDCKAFGKTATFAEKNLKKGTKIAIKGRLQTGSYEKDGKKFKTAEVIVSSHYFCEKRSQQDQQADQKNDDFVTIPIDVDDDGLPF